MKECTKCNNIKPLDHYPPDKRKKLGVGSICRLCRSNIYYHNKKEVVKAKSKEWYMRNPVKRKLSRANWKKNNPQKVKAIMAKHNLKSRFGLTLEDKDNMVKTQNNKCDICCQVFLKTPQVDHNHKTGKVRALLCSSCNRGLGNFRDNINLLQNAVTYLEKHGV